MPPFVAHDGGYPAAETAARRIVTDVGGRTGPHRAACPTSRRAEAYLYPVDRLGGNLHLTVAGTFGLGAYVVVCDDLFVTDCGGPAEDHAVAALAEPLRLVDRFDAAPGRTISVYIASAPVALTPGPLARPGRRLAGRPERPAPIGAAGGGPAESALREMPLDYATLELHVDQASGIATGGAGRRRRARRGGGRRRHAAGGPRRSGPRGHGSASRERGRRERREMTNAGPPEAGVRRPRDPAVEATESVP